MSNHNRRQFSAITSYEGNTFNIPRHKFSNFTAGNNGKNHASDEPKIEQTNSKGYSQSNTAVNNPKISALTGNNISKSPNRQFAKKANTNIKETNFGHQWNTSVSPKNTKQQKQPAPKNKQTNDQQNFNNKSPAKTYQINPATHTIKIQQKCIICETPTEKCCSLCRKVFYCSPQHQQIDWHTRHKLACQGKAAIQKDRSHHHTNNFTDHFSSNSTNNKFVFYSNNPLEYNNHHKNNQANERQIQNQTNIQKFLDLLEQRLVMRAKIMNQVSKLNQRTPLIVRQSLVRQTEQLILLSGKITNQEYKPSYTRKITKKDIMQYSSQQWGTQVIISQNGIRLQYIADMVLMAKMYHLCSMTKQARQLIISIGKIIQDSQQKKLFLQPGQPTNKNQTNKKPGNAALAKPLFSSANNTGGEQLIHSDDSLAKTKNLILQSIIQLSEVYNIDKTSQSAYKIYIKKIQLQEGIWEQIYAYFNIGVWYMDKTYFDKSVKSFLYALELLDSHKKNMPQSAVFKGDCLYNVAQGYWAQGQKLKAIQNMQECYRVRMNAIGKNSMQCSYSLYNLAKWYKDIQKWEECLQYLDQCHRVRKLYQSQPIYEQKLQQVRNLIIDVYEQIKKEKKKNNNRLQPRIQRYYQDLITQQRQQQHRQLLKKSEQSQLLPKGSVAARLFKDDKQYVNFRVVLSEEVYNQLTSDQVKYLAQLFQLTDKRMEKAQAIQTITQSNFVSCLNTEQREKFFKQNQIGKDVKKSFQ